MSGTILSNNYRNRIRIIFTIIAVAAAVISCSKSTGNTPTYQLTTSVSPMEGGSISPATNSFDEGTQVQVEATANENWIFDGWIGDISGSQNPVTVIMNSDKTINAQFVKRKYPLTINYEGEGSVTESIVQNKMTDYEYGTIVQLEANSDMGWNFARWSGDLETTENPATITMDGPKEVTVVFEANEYSIDIDIQGPGTATVTPDKDVYVYDETVTFEAIPNKNMQFLGWYGSFEMLQKKFDHQVTGDVELTAYFSTVKDAVVVETVEVEVDGEQVERVIFKVTNYLLEDIVLVGAIVENDEEEVVDELEFDGSPTLPGRTYIEVRVRFEGDGKPNKEELRKWIFTWLFDFGGKRYEKEQEVGEPGSNAKRKPITIQATNHLKEGVEGTINQ